MNEMTVAHDPLASEIRTELETDAFSNEPIGFNHDAYLIGSARAPIQEVASLAEEDTTHAISPAR
ncbi:MAG: hypothetical protein ACLQLT_10335 [Methylovirgula sp.]